MAKLSNDKNGCFKVRIGVDGVKTWNQLSDQGQLIIPAANVEGLEAAIAALSTSYYETENISELTGTYVNGDIAVEKQLIAGSLSSFVAYRYDKTTSTWKPLNGNYTAKDIYNDISALSASESADRADINVLNGDESTEGSVKKALSDAKGYTDSQIVTLSGNLVGASTDLSTANTIFGAKKYAEIAATDAKLAGELSALSVRTDLESDYVKYTQINGGKTVLTDTNKIVTQKDIASLTGVMHFKGVALNNALSTGSTTIPVPPYSSAADTPVSGDVVIDKVGTEFVWAISSEGASGCWYKIGDEGTYATKAELNAHVEDNTRHLSSDEQRAAVNSGINAARVSTYDGYNETITDKVKVGSYLSESETYDISSVDSLSVVKIDAEDYYRLVAEGTYNKDMLYVVSSDNLNAFDERIINVASAVISSDATNLKQVQDMISESSAEIVSTQISAIKLNDQEFTVTNHIAELSIYIYNKRWKFH